MSVIYVCYTHVLCERFVCGTCVVCVAYVHCVLVIVWYMCFSVCCFFVSLGCAFVCSICRCESGVCVVMVRLIVSALTTVL